MLENQNLKSKELIIVGAGPAGLRAAEEAQKVAEAAQKASEAANHAKSEFLANMSHELRTPLNVILGLTQLMVRNAAISEEERENLEIIHHSGEHLLSLINNVLELSRIERRDPAQPLRLGDIRGVVREVVDVLRPHAKNEGLSLELDLAERLPQVRHEPDTLRQILFNLIDNSLKYCRDASDQRITIACQVAPSGVTLSVRDRGPGVASAQLGRIFDPFYRGERELTRKHAGTGIGLALVKGLAERMGGSVQASNAEPGLEVRVSLAGEQG